ncbi:MAG: phenylalanine--tRNA ligase subunit beta, partial [Myxococcales bacterium]|nr:phenylalanine--tRNA ligase subunit beta [Myxococcales bacterium]
MKVPLDWLAEWIDLPPLDALDERLTVGGLEIDEVIRQGPELTGLIVGSVEARENHPDADRLALCRVDIGAEAPVEIVCGAPNVAAGQKVVVAPHGAVLPDGTKIKRSKIRGVRSNGMICSAKELGLGEDHSGILTLPEDAPVGEAAASVLGGNNWILDIAITPNRGDWLSMLGMAREVRAHFGGELRLPETEPAATGPAAGDALAIHVDDAEGCPRYCGRVVRGVHVRPSPDWMRERLEAAGVRPINNVVDVT